MKSLIKEIGLVPSELTLKELVDKIAGERIRVSRSLEVLRTTPSKKKTRKTTKPKKKSKAAKNKETLEAIKAMGVNINELLCGE